MIANRDILCFSHDWTGDPLSKTHLMRLLAKENRVLWVNSIGYRAPKLGSGRDWKRIVAKLNAMRDLLREVEPNLFVLNTLAIPAWGKPGIQSLNRQLLRFQVLRAMRRLQFSAPINWVFNPAAGVIAGTLGEAAVIYYCVDEYTAFTGVPRKALEEIEQTLIKRADAIVVSAEKLMQSKRSTKVPTTLVRHGVDFDHFRRALDDSTLVPEDIRSLPKPIIGYFGLMSEDWIDVDLLVHVARSFPQASLVLLGKVAMDLSRLLQEPNIYLLGRKPYQALPNYCKAFDVAVIPFPITEVTLHANPLKAREYLAAGLPVVSTDIPEVAVLNGCRLAKNHGEFVDHIRRLVECPGPNRERSETMRGESWAARLREVCEHLEPILGRK